MFDTDYAAMLEKAKLDRAQAGAEQMVLSARIAHLDAVIAALRTMVERPTIDPAKGITVGIQTVLKMAYPSGAFPTTVRVVLEKNGFDFSGQVNPMASIHAILKRLVKRKAIRETTTPGGYVWIDPDETIPKKHMDDLITKADAIFAKHNARMAEVDPDGRLREVSNEEPAPATAPKKPRRK